MKNTQFLLLSLSLILLGFAANAQTENEPIISEPVSGMIIDGDETDWENAISFFDEKSGLMYSVANDKENLYLLIKATEEMAQRKFTGGGVEVWISPDGKEKRKTGIKYPIPLSWEERRAMRERSETREQARQQSRSQGTYKTMELRGFENIKNDIYVIDTLGIKTEYSGESGNSIVEYKIPFSTFCTSEQVSNDNVIAIGIILNGIQMPNFGGGRPGGRMQQSGTERRDMRKMAESNTLWIYTKLSIK